MLFFQDQHGFFDLTEDFIANFTSSTFSPTDLMAALHFYHFFEVRDGKLRVIWHPDLPDPAMERVIVNLIVDLASTSITNNPHLRDDNFKYWQMSSDFGIPKDRLTGTYVFGPMSAYFESKRISPNRYSFELLRVYNDRWIGIDIEHHRADVREAYSRRCHQLSYF